MSRSGGIAGSWGSKSDSPRTCRLQLQFMHYSLLGGMKGMKMVSCKKTALQPPIEHRSTTMRAKFEVSFPFPPIA